MIPTGMLRYAYDDAPLISVSEQGAPRRVFPGTTFSIAQSYTECKALRGKKLKILLGGKFHKHTTKKLLALVVVLAMLMSLGFSANAIGDELIHGSGVPPTDAGTCPTYRADLVTPVTSEITVTFIMEAGDAYSWDYEFGESIPNSAFYLETTKTIHNSNGVTVIDLLEAVDANNIYNLDFDIVTSLEYPEKYLNTVSRHLNADLTATWNGTGQWGFDGWAFRINDKFPLKAVNGGYQGTSAEYTYLENGDIVHFFYDAPSNFDEDTITAANYVRARYVPNQNQSGGYVQMESHDTFIDQPNDWDFYVNPYTPLDAGVSVDVYSLNGTTLTYVDTYCTDSNGILLNCNLSSGTYIAKTVSSCYVFTDTDWEDFFTDLTYFDYTSAYSRIIVPAV